MLHTEGFTTSHKASNKLPVSVIIVAHNEERILGRCLESIADIAQEIIVVINDCTDRTAEIAKSFGASVYEHTWMGFGAQKQYAYEKVTQPWILNLDADEVLSEELRQSLQKFFDQGEDQQFDGAKFNRCNNYMNRWLKHGIAYPDHVLRLSQKNKAHWSNKKVHEALIFPKGSRIKHLHGDLFHYTYKNLMSSWQKQLSYAQIFAKENPIQNLSLSFLNRLFLHPLYGFLRSYILRLGFLDGLPGFCHAVQTFAYTFLKYAFILDTWLRR